MPTWFWLLITGVLGAIGAVASNWLPKPAKLKPLSIVIILAFVTLALIGMGLVASSSDTDPSAVDTAPNASTTRSTEPRSLQTWISRVNDICSLAKPKLEAEKARHEAAQSTEAEVVHLKNARKLLEPVVSGVNLEQMPSDPEDRAKAREWIDSYNKLYEQFIAGIRAIEHYAELNPLEQLFEKAEFESAQQKFLDAATAAKSRSDRLGIACPGMNI